MKTRVKENSLIKLLLLLLLLLVITFIQGSYNFIRRANHVSRARIIAAILLLQFLAHVMLFPMFNVLYFNSSTFRSMSASFNMAVFCSSIISYFPLFSKESMIS